MDLERNMVIQELNSEGGGLSMDMSLKELISTKLWRKVYLDADSSGLTMVIRCSELHTEFSFLSFMFICLVFIFFYPNRKSIQ